MMPMRHFRGTQGTTSTPPPRAFIRLIKERQRPWDAEGVLRYLRVQLGPRAGLLGPALLNEAQGSSLRREVQSLLLGVVN